MNGRNRIGYNMIGRRVGESHPRAKLTDREVEMIHQLHEQHGLGYRRIAAKFECSWYTVRDIVTRGRRSSKAVRYKTVGMTKH